MVPGFAAGGVVVLGFVQLLEALPLAVVVFVAVLDVPGGQVVVPGGVVGVVGVAGGVVVGGAVVVLGVVGVGGMVVVCAKAGRAILTTSPPMDARPRIIRELMRLFLLGKQKRKA